MSTEAVGDGIYTIDTGYVRPHLDASHLLVFDGEAAFVDTGVSASVPHLLAALSAHRLTPAQVRYILLTHIHLDHAGGAGVLLSALPNATVVVHPRGARHLSDPTRLIAGSTVVYGEALFHQLYGEIRPISEARITVSGDYARLPLGGRWLTFLHTPGHARHHHCILEPTGGSIFTGDAFGLSYRELDVDGRPFIFPTTTPVDFDPEEAHASLDRIVATGAEAAYLTHYGRVTALPRLAGHLHGDLDAFVSLTLAAADIDGLGEALLVHLQARLDDHGDSHTAAERRDLLWMDVALNAQGLWFWREHRR